MQRLKQLEDKPPLGYRRLRILRDREGLVVNHKPINQIYRAAGLQVRRRRRKSISPAGARPPAGTRPADGARVDGLMPDMLADGRTCRTLNMVDDFTRECVAIEVDRSLPRLRVDAEAAIEAWRVDYNTVRPHSSLAGRTPEQFARMSVGARRLPAARPDEGLKPGGCNYFSPNSLISPISLISLISL